MSLKIAHNALCFKFEDQELLGLLQGQKISNLFKVSGVLTGYCVKGNDQSDPCQLIVDNNILHLDVSHLVLRELKELGKDRKGLSFQIGDLTIILQLDIRSLSS